MATHAFSRLPMQAILGCLLLAAPSSGQTALPQASSKTKVDRAELTKALASVKSDDASSYSAEIIAEAGATEAIPDLEKQFEKASDSMEKAKYAQVLLLLGDKRDLYWNFLKGLAAPVLASDALDPIKRDAHGKSMPGLSEEWVSWAGAHNQPQSAGEDAIYVYPGIIGLLGLTGDPRAVPLLREALLSPNGLIQAAAANGLANMHDEASVSLLIEACRKAPAETAELIARSLVYFDDSDAQKAVDSFVPKEEAKALREAKAQGKKTPWLN